MPTAKTRRLAILAPILLLFAASPLAAEEAFFFPSAKEIQFDDENLAGELGDQTAYRSYWRIQEKANAMWPYVVLQGDGEAYVDQRARTPWSSSYVVSDPNKLRISVRLANEGDVRGWLVVPKRDYSEMVRLPFTIPASVANKAARDTFYQVKESHYRSLLDRGVAGAAWFRRQARLARAEHGGRGDTPDNVRQFSTRNDFDDTFEMFSGGRAISENLQLDRELVLRGEDERRDMEISTIKGITIAEVKWKELLKGAKPELDPLARFVPHDQHGLYFPDFKALLAVMDEADGFGTQILNILEPRTEDARTAQNYRTQLCLETSGLSRILGPQVIASVAVTGSDPYLRTGSDVAVLFEAKSTNSLTAFIKTKQATAKKQYPSVKDIGGEINGVKYEGVRSPDRKVCSYLAVLDGKVVVVTNSEYQLRRIIDSFQGNQPSMATLDEYKFFRHRYQRGANNESAFLMLTDAAIRRWCSPRWRIGNSRRIRAGGVMAELQAENLPEFVAEAFPEPIEYPRTVGGMGQIHLTPGGVTSAVYGGLEFLTPIAELELDKVTRAEAQAYENWRRGYERNWNGVFDPIGVQVTASPGKLAADVTVMPLIGGTEYRDVIQIVGDEKIESHHGDRHKEALLHFILALDVTPPRSIVAWIVDGLKDEVDIKEPLSWFDGSIAVYIDPDPILAKFAEAEDPEKFWRENDYYFPIAVFFQSKDEKKLGEFMAALQKRLDRTDADWFKRVTKKHAGREYVEITPDDSGINAHIYYTVAPEGLTVALSEDVLKRAIERTVERKKVAATREGEKAAAKETWLGEHFAVHLTPSGVKAVERVFSREYTAILQARCWGNLPILNEWKRRFPKQEPMQLHATYWGTQLVCPGGGKYVWNEKHKTFESTVFGHPAEPKAPSGERAAGLGFKSIQAGVTFENNGLRARAVLTK